VQDANSDDRIIEIRKRERNALAVEGYYIAVIRGKKKK